MFVTLDLQMFLSMNHGDTKSVDLFESEETPPPQKKAKAWQNQAGPWKPPLWRKRNSVSFFFDGMRLLLYLLLQLLPSMVGFTATPPVDVVCSSVGINDATDVVSSLTVVVMVISPVAVEEAASWTTSNYQARVIHTNVINHIDHTFDWNWWCVYVGPAFF